MTSYLNAFKTTFLGYYPVSQESFSLIESLIQFQELKKDEVLLHEGEVAKNIHFVCKGAMIAYFSDAEGNTYNKNIFLENQFAGSTVSMLLKVPSQFTLQAIEDCIIITINYRRYKELIYQHDDVKNFYIAYLERNWIIEKEQREISIVMENAAVRYLKLLKTHPDIDKRIPLQHIASHLGITPTQLSRIRKELKEK
ncbi:Crp/Fnr family transcriptional regulator [Flavobacterium sp.]|uniref:Crp/Fnr family transcriptional regulator n=1 Tax=Flavobacterium sp. TaxID=239 RepID=UPI003D6BE82B